MCRSFAARARLVSYHYCYFDSSETNTIYYTIYASGEKGPWVYWAMEERGK